MALAPGTYGGVALDAGQVAIADQIAAVAKTKGATDRDLTVAYMTAMQESSLHNYTHATDHDSLGVFQQRPSTGWGTPAQVTNVAYAAGKFFDALLGINNRNSLQLTQEAQGVQRSAFPGAYAKWQPMAEALVSNHPGGILGPGVGSPDSGGGSFLDPLLRPLKDLAAPFQMLLWFTQANHWVRIFAGGFGVVFVFMGLTMLTKEVRG